MSKLEKVGVVGVDSGQVMICDPCYIESEWKKSSDEDVMSKKKELKGEFSYAGVCHTTSGETRCGQLDYTAGHAGAGIASCTLIGDGCYPVFAMRDEDNGVEALIVDFRLSDYDSELKLEDIPAILMDPTITDKNGMPRSTRELKEQVIEKQSSPLWAGIRRLEEGTTMLKELLPDMEENIIPELAKLQGEVTGISRNIVEEVSALITKMNEITAKLGTAEPEPGLNDLEPLS